MASRSLQHLEKLKSATSISDEIAALEAIRFILLRAEQRAPKDPEEEWLTLASCNLGDEVLDNPFPRSTPEGLFPRQCGVNQFTCYVFRRRFGWSEAATNSTGEETMTGSSLTKEGAVSFPGPHQQQQVMLKHRLNEILDEFVKWFLGQPVSKPLLQSLRHTIIQAADKPVVRNQTVVHSMDWLKLNKSNASIHANYADIVPVIMAGLTDIWSAIRKACVSRLPGILGSFTVREAEDFFVLLAKICQSDESSWQAIEGALMAISSLLRRFQWINRMPVEPFSGFVDKERYFVKFGNEELSSLPSFITSHMHSIAYPLLAHPQLSVRECAIKAFTSFLSRCDFQEALSSLSEAISRLGQCSAPSLPSSPKKRLADPSPPRLPHHAVLRKEFKFLDAYEAEGLLGVCLYLIKHIPPGFLLSKWPYYFSVFSLYLMHPASTVRQATSELFRYLVAKDCNNSALLKLVLQGLSANWGINIKYMSQPAHTFSHFYTLTLDLSHDPAPDDTAASSGPSRPAAATNVTSLHPTAATNLTSSRPTAATSLTSSTAENNSNTQPEGAGAHHHQATAGAAHAGASSAGPSTPSAPATTRSDRAGSISDVPLVRSGTMEGQSPRQSRRRQQPFYGQGKAVSIVNVNQLEGDISKSPIDSVLCRAWEWREGRLFAYELIIKFLIVNHIHYLFPSFVMPPLKFNGAASTDESIIPSHKANKVPQGRPPVQKSQSHGGMSLRQAWLKRSPSEDSNESSGSPAPHAVTTKPPTPPPMVTPPTTPPLVKQDSDETVLSRAGSERRNKGADSKRHKSFTISAPSSKNLATKYAKPTRKMLQRAQTMAEGNFFNQPMTKHYSFPCNPDESSLPGGGRRASAGGLSGTLSLLGISHDADKKLRKTTKNLLEAHKANLLEPFQETEQSGPPSIEHEDDDDQYYLSVEARHLLDTYKALVRNDRGEHERSTSLPWLTGLQLDSLTNILNQMLLQTVNSLASSRWELRRMSQQALPLVAECLRWYHPESLIRLWNQCLTSDASLVCYGAALTLKHSVQHANRMMQFLQQPVSGWRRDSESCRQVSASIVVAVTQGLSGYVATATQLMQREVIDKLSLVAMEILLLALAHFVEELEDERDALEKSIHQFQLRIFSHAHPTSAVCKTQSKFTTLQDVLIPLDGFLCCCLKDESAQSYSKQLERYTLRETGCLALDYLRRCTPATAAQTLPIALAQLHGYQEDEDIAKTLLDGCCLLVTRLKGYITENGNMGTSRDFNSSLELALAEISSLVKVKTLDLSTLRQVLEMYRDLSLCVPSTNHLQTLFAAMASRLDLSSLNPSALHLGHDEDGDGRLVLFASNDIPASPVDMIRISDDEDEEEDRKGNSHPLSESLALNASSGSGQTPRLSTSSDPTTRALGASPAGGTDVEDDDSDWDSWDEDEEDQSVFQEAMADFLRQLLGYLGSDTFQAELSQSSDQERQFIRTLLSS